MSCSSSTRSAVDAGYTEGDVKNSAFILTRWTVDGDKTFRYDSGCHYVGTSTGLRGRLNDRILVISCPALAQTADDAKTLVVLFLRGGIDGSTSACPTAIPSTYDKGPSLGIRAASCWTSATACSA